MTARSYSPPPQRLLRCIAITLIVAGAEANPAPVAPTELSCSDRTGFERARCERQRAMQQTCDGVSDAFKQHCERCVHLANPIACVGYSGDERQQCDADNEALAACSEGTVEGFMVCMTRAAVATPRRIVSQR